MKDAGWYYNPVLATYFRETRKFYKLKEVGREYIEINFDLNDAALCVDEMRKKGRLRELIFFAKEEFNKAYDRNAIWLFFAWLMTMESGEAVNFFAAMAA